MKKLLVLLVFTVAMQPSFSQNGGKLDSLFAKGDTTAVLDSLLKDFDLYLDSLTGRKSFFTVNTGIGTGFFSFNDRNTVTVNTEKKLIFSPSVGYFHKSGLGIAASAYALLNNGINFYQYSFSPSFDCIKNSFSAGVAYTRYLTKDSLDFYTTPIQNELFAYFSYKKWWVRPTLSLSYGWGSKAEYEKREATRFARLLEQRDRYYVIIKNVTSVRDFSATISVRKDIDWYSVFSKADNITLTPIAMLNAGTQNYGFNTSYSYNFSPVRANSLPSNNDISDNTQFALQSACLAIRGSYLKGRFLLQSQVLFDYFLQDLEGSGSKLNTVYSITAGLSF
ncbi:hypothetical protein FAM09_22640 [Niastella caeni]|uniref:DUF3078 domain-containing protein n=1 Tax=Niastella caeni TaxID=2569763 RepID=A0A4S8HI62_9BACT|nr:hypothetical protein [Niastella caeni]THU34797.1 hypothetical protein FAM09_22640 [Niastella caeni]